MEDSLIAPQGSSSTVWSFICSPKEYLINVYDVSNTILEAKNPNKSLALTDLNF